MLKVIAEDFIHPEHIDTVMPWYRRAGGENPSRAAVHQL